jgi:hypothetical protein
LFLLTLVHIETSYCFNLACFFSWMLHVRTNHSWFICALLIHFHCIRLRCTNARVSLGIYLKLELLGSIWRAHFDFTNLRSFFDHWFHWFPWFQLLLIDQRPSLEGIPSQKPCFLPNKHIPERKVIKTLAFRVETHLQQWRSLCSAKYFKLTHLY